MSKVLLVLLLPLAIVGSTPHPRSEAEIHRRHAEMHRFEVMTGYPRGRHGYWVDHICPLECGGADDPNNMQWQLKAAARAKDRWEGKACSCLCTKPEPRGSQVEACKP